MNIYFNRGNTKQLDHESKLWRRRKEISNEYANKLDNTIYVDFPINFTDKDVINEYKKLKTDSELYYTYTLEYQHWKRMHNKEKVVHVKKSASYDIYILILDTFLFFRDIVIQYAKSNQIVDEIDKTLEHYNRMMLFRKKYELFFDYYLEVERYLTFLIWKTLNKEQKIEIMEKVVKLNFRHLSKNLQKAILDDVVKNYINPL